MNQDLVRHLDIDDQARDLKWENRFFQLLSKSSLELISDTPQNGPDGWPYLMVKSTEGNEESFQKILHWLCERGIGLVINPQKNFPDFVFTYGMIWHYKMTGLFYNSSGNNIQSGEFEFTIDDKSQMGPPTENYLPQFVRKVIRQFFLDQGILRPRILVITDSFQNHNLCFSLESLGTPPKNEHLGIGEALSWFLPPHYSVALISEKALPAFEDL